MEAIQPYYQDESAIIYKDDCLQVMPTLPDRSIDAIICDLPYGTTACKWDVVIPFAPLWEQYKRLIKPKGAIVLFGSQPFTSLLVTSNLEWFKWEEIWKKSHATGHLNCKVMPLRQHENILVFGDGKITYNPEIKIKPFKDVRASRKSAASTSCYGNYKNESKTTIPLDASYPRSVIEFNSPNHGEKGLHPTQKPVALLKYLIKTYTNAGDTILDNTMGSGTTLVAAKELGRRAIGIETEEKYCKRAVKRLSQSALNFTEPEPQFVQYSKYEQVGLLTHIELEDV